ncbi:unnamed protein product, partial [Prorocentrum cordatum]
PRDGRSGGAPRSSTAPDPPRAQPGDVSPQAQTPGPRPSHRGADLESLRLRFIRSSRVKQAWGDEREATSLKVEHEKDEEQARRGRSSTRRRSSALGRCSSAGARGPPPGRDAAPPARRGKAPFGAERPQGGGPSVWRSPRARAPARKRAASRPYTW